MAKSIKKTQTARLLAAFIRHSSEKGEIADEKKFLLEIGQLYSNGNDLDTCLYELNNEGIVHYEEIGEDGFAPIIMVGATKRTHEYLASLLQEIDGDMEDLKRRLSEILTFDPESLKAEIASAAAQLNDARKSAEESELLRPLLQQISIIERHFNGVAVVADKYEDVYKNIIRPVQLEGESGVRATVRWAIIGIVASTVISIVLGNWKDIVAIFGKTQ
ncbi:MAG: hypothetical protein V4582_20680 [Pseudomonadota bacterium]